MATDDEHPLFEHSTVALVSDAADAASEPSIRPAIFLRPRAGDDADAAPPAPPGGPGPVPARPHAIEAEFGGWARVPRRWPEWVAKLRRRHEPLWREAGILRGVLASTRRVRRRQHERALLHLAAFWSADTGIFVFPWGEATLTLEDVDVLFGLPLLGVPVREPVSDSLEKDVARIEAVRAVLYRSKKKKPAYGAWVNHFVDRAQEEEDAPAPPYAAAGELDVEHGAFLSMWLSLFVLPGSPFDVVRREVLPLAARLARGQRVSLAPAALATIYHDLSALKRRITSGKKNQPFVVSAPMHIVQLWVWEHFTQLRPEPVGSSAPGDPDMPRAARWHEAGKKLSSKDVHAVFISPKEFQWRPYGKLSLLGLQPEMGGFKVCSQDDIATKEALLSLARCLHPCELVGMNCIQQYNPHRVARQLGFDQDIPGTVPRATSGWEKAWETYNIEAKSSAFIFPNHKPGVTVQYAKWWKPYTSACGSAIGNAAKMKEGHDFVTPAKRKLEGVLAGNSGKKVCVRVGTATQGRPPNIPAQSSGSHAARTRAAAAPGLVLRACPPHLRSRAMSATGTPQVAPDADDDPQDHISLSERLNSITKMHKQPTGCLVKGGEQERIFESLKIVISKSPSVGSNKAVLHKVIEQAFPDAVGSSATIVDESSCGFVTERPQAECLQQSKDGDLNTANGENSSRTEDCDVVLLNVVQGAVSTGRNEAIGAGTEVDMLPTHEDVLVISDDDECDKSSSKGHEESAMHLKSHMSEAKMSLIGEQNEYNKLVDARNDEQDSKVLKKVTKQVNFGDIVEISDDELDEETSKKAGVSVKATSKEDALSNMHLKSPVMEPTRTMLQECNKENQMVRETNDEQDNGVMKEGTVQNSYDHEVASVQDDTTLRRQTDVLTHASTIQTNDGLLQGPTEEMDTCIVTGDIGNIDKVPNENGGSLNFSEKVTTQVSFSDVVEISDDELDEETSKKAGVFVEATSKEDALSTMCLKSPEMEPTWSSEENQMVREINDEQDNGVMKEGTVQSSYDHQVASVQDDTTLRQQPDVLTHAATVETNDGLLQGPTEEMDTCILTGDIDSINKVPNANGGSLNFSEKVTTQGNFGDVVEISGDELDEETSNKDGVFVEATSKEDAPSTMCLKSPEMEPLRTISQVSNEEKQMVREANDEQDNGVMKEGMVQNSYDHQLANIQDDTTLRRQPDVLTHAATVQTNDGLLQVPTEEMDTCIVTGDNGNTDKVPNENGGSLNFSEKGSEDILVSNQGLERPMEDSAGASRKKSGNSERSSSRLLEGNTKLVSHEVCTKTLYYLSRFDRMKDAWDKDGNSLPRRAVGTMEMIQKASAIRQAEMAELKIKINTLKEEIRALEAAEKGKSP